MGQQTRKCNQNQLMHVVPLRIAQLCVQHGCIFNNAQDVTTAVQLIGEKKWAAGLFWYQYMNHIKAAVPIRHCCAVWLLKTQTGLDSTLQNIITIQEFCDCVIEPACQSLVKVMQMQSIHDYCSLVTVSCTAEPMHTYKSGYKPCLLAV